MTERGHGVVDVAKRLGMSDKSLYLWVRLAKEQPGVGTGENTTLKAEVSRLKAELKRVNEERDILKKAATYFAKLSGRSMHSWPRIKANFDCTACAGCYAFNAAAITLGRKNQIQSALWQMNFCWYRSNNPFKKGRAFTAVHACIVICVKRACCAEKNALLV